MANPHQINAHDSTWRNRIMRSLATDVILHGQILTTLSRAKALRVRVDKLVTLAKKNDLAAKRQALRYLRKIPRTPSGKSVLQHLFDVVGPKYKNRAGGYTSVIHANNRRGDNAPMAIIKLV